MNTTTDQAVQNAYALRSEYLAGLILKAVNSLRRRATENNPGTGGLTTSH